MGEITFFYTIIIILLCGWALNTYIQLIANATRHFVETSSVQDKWYPHFSDPGGCRRNSPKDLETKYHPVCIRANAIKCENFSKSTEMYIRSTSNCFSTSNTSEIYLPLLKHASTLKFAVDIDQGIHRVKLKVAWNEKWKTLPGFFYAHEIWQILKHFTRTKSRVQNSFFWRLCY